jgi:hypothetical protein
MYVAETFLIKLSLLVVKKQDHVMDAVALLEVH